MPASGQVVAPQGGVVAGPAGVSHPDTDWHGARRTGQNYCKIMSGSSRSNYAWALAVSVDHNLQAALRSVGVVGPTG